MTRPDLDALQALLDKATPQPWEFGGALCLALRDLLPYVRELERERDQSTLNRACADALVSAAQDMTQAAALAMRERCAQACAALKVNRPSDPLANAFDGACETCAAAVRALAA